MTNKELVKDFRRFVGREVLPLGRANKKERWRLRLVLLGAFILLIILIYILKFFPEYSVNTYMYIAVGLAAAVGVVYKYFRNKINYRRNASSWNKAIDYFKDLTYSKNAENVYLYLSKWHKGHSLSFNDINVIVTSILKDPPSERTAGFLSMIKSPGNFGADYGMCLALQVDVFINTKVRSQVQINPCGYAVRSDIYTTFNKDDFRLYFDLKSSDEKSVKNVLTEKGMEKLVKWKTSRELVFYVHENKVSIIYEAKHARFGSDVASEHEADDYRKYDPFIMAYATARLFKSKVSEIFGEE